MMNPSFLGPASIASTAGWVAALATGAIALLHVGWAFRRASEEGLPSNVIPAGEDGAPIFAPGRAVTLMVAVGLASAGAAALVASGAVDFGGGRGVARLVAGGAALVFLGRTVGDFRYVGVFKRVRDTRYARWDTRLYTPVALGLGALLGYAAL